MKLKCKRCKKLWDYSGSKKPKLYPQYTSCPVCKSTVLIPKIKGDSIPVKDQGDSSNCPKCGREYPDIKPECDFCEVSE